MTVNTDAYLEFVDAVTSIQSKDHEAFIYRIQELQGQDFHAERLLTAAVGVFISLLRYREPLYIL